MKWGRFRYVILNAAPAPLYVILNAASSLLYVILNAAPAPLCVKRSGVKNPSGGRLACLSYLRLSFGEGWDSSLRSE